MSLLDSASLILTPNAGKEGKLYSVIPSNGNGDFTVTRATTATRVNSAGLVELVPYNLVQYSEQFDNATWTKQNVSSSANQTTAPNGTLTADTIVNNNTSTFHRYYQGPIANLGQPQKITFSVYLKYKDHQYTSIGITDDTFYRSQVVVDLVNGTITQNYKQNSGDTLTSTITNVGNGWYRLTGTFTYLTALSGGNAYILGMLLNQSTFTEAPYLGSGTGIYIWGAQMVEGSNAKDYQPTETRLNIPRLDYSNGTCPSLLVEPQRTNLLKYSQDYSNVIWTKAGITATLGTQINPQGIASTYNIANTTLGDSYLEQQGLPTTTGTYTTSVFIKNIDNLATTQLMAVHIAEGSITSQLVYTWATNTFTIAGTNAISGSVTPYANGWVRLSFTYSIGALTTIHWSRLYANNDLTVTKSALVYGFQTELGSYPTSYIPTTSASVTRNADEVYKTGISSLIGQTEGTIYLEADVQKHNESEFYIAISNGSSLGEAIYLYQPSGGILQVLFRSGGVDPTISILNANWNIGYNKIAIAYNSTSGEVFMNGVSKGTIALSALPTCSQLTLGARPDSPGSLVGSGGYKIATLWKTRLTNEQLELLTGNSFNTYAEMAAFYNYTLQ
jgi:hypothetical protein